MNVASLQCAIIDAVWGFFSEHMISHTLNMSVTYPLYAIIDAM